MFMYIGNTYYLCMPNDIKFFIIRTSRSENLSNCIDYVHENYLKQICEDSEFQGLKYHGGPIAKCKCKDSEKIVLDYVSTMNKESKNRTTSDTLRVSKKIVECEDCLVSQDIDDLLKVMHAHIVMH